MATRLSSSSFVKSATDMAEGAKTIAKSFATGFLKQAQQLTRLSRVCLQRRLEAAGVRATIVTATLTGDARDAGARLAAPLRAWLAGDAVDASSAPFASGAPATASHDSAVANCGRFA